MIWFLVDLVNGLLLILHEPVKNKNLGVFYQENSHEIAICDVSTILGKGEANKEVNKRSIDHINVLVIVVSNGSDNGLLPDGTKPLPEPMLIYQQ